MEDNVTWIIIAIFFWLILLQPANSKYQVTRYGKDRAIIIDSNTGEAWTTEEYEQYGIINKKITTLVPIGYSDRQKDEWTYTPDEPRNDKNTTWWEWLKRKLAHK